MSLFTRMTLVRNWSIVSHWNMAMETNVLPFISEHAKMTQTAHVWVALCNKKV